MVAAVVLVVLVAAFLLLRAWDNARDASWDEPPPPDADPPARGTTPPAPPSVRVTVILVSLVLGLVSYVAVPLVLDAALDGGDGGRDRRWVVCGDGVAVSRATAPGGSGTVYLSDRGCP